MKYKKVMLTFPWGGWPIARQTPGESLRWGNCEFFTNTTLRECDAWVVLDDLPATFTTRCPANQVILMLGEHQEIKSYPREYVSQFSQVYGSHDGIDSSLLKGRVVALPWHAGVQRPYSKCNLTYDDFVAMTPPTKNKILSTVCSSKRQTKGHRERLAFVKALKSRLGDQFDIFGPEFTPIGDKWDAIYPYQYHLVIENGSHNDYWTEKLADCFLGFSYPLYAGCPNLADYFSKQSFTPIDIKDMDHGIATTLNIIKSKPSALQAEFIIEARQKVLHDYNMIGIIERLINSREAEAAVECTIQPSIAFNPRGSVSRLMPQIKSWFCHRNG